MQPLEGLPRCLLEKSQGCRIPGQNSMARFTTNHNYIREACALIGAASIIVVALLVQGGDCEAIEQYVLALFAECVCKITQKVLYLSK